MKHLEAANLFVPMMRMVEREVEDGWKVKGSEEFPGGRGKRVWDMVRDARRRRSNGE